MQPLAGALTSLTTPAQWKILIVDEDSQKLINNVVKEDDILNLNITSMRR
jgi:syntaxin-binding protein 1